MINALVVWLFVFVIMAIVYHYRAEIEKLQNKISDLKKRNKVR